MATKRRSRSLSTSGDTDSSRENSANDRAPSSALAITTVPHRSPITSDAPGNVDSGSAGSAPRLRRGCSRGSDPANEGTQLLGGRVARRHLRPAPPADERDRARVLPVPQLGQRHVARHPVALPPPDRHQQRPQVQPARRQPVLRAGAAAVAVGPGLQQAGGRHLPQPPGQHGIRDAQRVAPPREPAHAEERALEDEQRPGIGELGERSPDRAEWHHTFLDPWLRRS